MKVALISFSCLIFSGIAVYAQPQYSISYSVFGDYYGGNFEAYNIDGTLYGPSGAAYGFSGFNGAGSGSFTANELPNLLRLVSSHSTWDYDGNEAIICASTDNFGLNLGLCSTFTNTYTSCGLSFTMTLVVKPIAISLSGSSNYNLCGASDYLTLTATSGYEFYEWYYSTASVGWTLIGTTSSSSIQIHKSDVPLAKLNENVYFKFGYSGCNLNNTSSNTSSAYVFRDPLSVANTNIVKPICPNGNDGSVTVSLSRSLYNGESFTPNIYNSTGSTLLKNGTTNDPTITGLSPGSYTVMVESPYNCGPVHYEPFTIPNGPRIALTASAPVTSSYNGVQTSCPGVNNGQITVSASGGNNSFKYFLDGVQQSGSVITGVSAGTHTVRVDDTCPTANSVTISNVNVSGPSMVSISSATASLCNGTNNGQINISASGGTGTLSYSVDNGSSFQFGNGTFTGLSTGTNYTIRVRDANNCSVGGQIVFVPGPVVAGSASVTSPSCYNGSNGSVLLSTASGGSGSYSYSIPGFSAQPIGTAITVVPAGSYTVTVKDVNNCTATTSATVVNPSPLLIPLPVSKTDLTCASNPTGTMVINATGGTGALQYSIDNGNIFSSANSFGGLSAATYPVVVRDSKGCTASTFVTVSSPPAININAPVIAKQSCTAVVDGSITISASGGTGTLLYSLNGTTFQSSNVFTGLSANAYTVTIKDGNSCTATTPATVSMMPAITGTMTTSNYNGFAIKCKGDNSGSIDLTPGGGTPGSGPTYTFQWYKNGSAIAGAQGTTEDQTGLQTGNYAVKITDSKGCNITTSSTLLNEPSTSVAVSLSSKSDVTCFGAGNGSITVTASGGTGGIQYSKDGGSNYQVSNVFPGLTPTSYVITAKDANGCTSTTASIPISTPTAALSITSITKNNPKCNGSADGSFVVVAAGGTSPYKYSSGSGFITSNTLPSLSAGSYTVTVQDANNCSISSTSQTLTNPVALSFSSVTTSPQSCAVVVDGKVTASATGGTGTLQYSINGSTFQASGSFTSLTANTYTVTVRDANTCTNTSNATVGTVPAVNGTITQTAFISCHGDPTAALSVAGSGGTSPYNYNWSTSSSSSSITSLVAGSYSVTITDSKGCSASKSTTVTEPSILSVALTKSNFNGFGISCQGSTDGFINMTVSGGSPGYTYAWSNGASIKDIATLSAGGYNVTVTDSKGCQASGSATLTAPGAVTVSVSATSNVVCNGGNTGSITVAGNGGASGYTFSINGGTSYQGSATFPSLAAGSYTIKVKDQNNCTNQTSSIAITQPSAVTVTSSNVVNATCGQPNGSAQANGAGGGGTYTYQWKNVSNQVIGNVSSISGLASGSYSAYATDQFGCVSATPITVAISSTNGAVFTVTSITSVTCPTSLNGAAQVSITSGTGPYAITWSSGETGTNAIALPAGTNTASVKDGNNCTVVKTFTTPSPTPISLSSVVTTPPTCPGGSTASIQVQAAGGTGGYTYEWNGSSGTNTLSNVLPITHQLVVRDASNCSYSQSITIADLPPISMIVTKTPPSCAASTDGIITVQASGGNGGFTYHWPGNTTGPQFVGLGAGSYTVAATDVKNCILQNTITLIAPDPVTISIGTSTPTSCHGLQDGQLNLTASGGTNGYQYSINNGQSWQNSSIFPALFSGTYTASARDNNGCTASTSATVTEPQTLTAAITNIRHTTCGLPNGSAEALVSGGNGNYQYDWRDAANQQVSTSGMYATMSAGAYILNVIDAKQCSATTTLTINASSASQLQVTSIQQTSCTDTSDGKATVKITGTAPYNIAWSSGETTATAVKLSPGTNTIKITDGNSCETLSTFQVPSPTIISLIETIQNPSCPGTPSGSVQVLASGGAGNYQYTWNSKDGNNTLTNASAGDYVLKVTDSKNCSTSKTITLVDLPAIIITAHELKTATCVGGSDGRIVADATGANGSFHYVWNTGVTGNTLTNIQAGTYQITATDLIGCSKTTSITLAEPTPFVFDLGPDKTICVGQTYTVSAPIDNATYSWSSADGPIAKTKSIQITKAGRYSLHIVNSDGCEAEDSFEVKTSTDLLHADFLAVSEANAGDSILVIDISWPLPDNITWSLPKEGKVIEQNKDYSLITFSKAGVYSLSVTANLGQCVDIHTSSITIHEKLEDTPGGRTTTDYVLIKTFNAYPNPNRGDFAVEVELGEPLPINLSLISTEANRLVWKDQQDGKQNYMLSVSVPDIKAGTYFLMLKVNNKTKVLQVLKL